MTCSTCAQIRAILDRPLVPATPLVHVVDEFIDTQCLVNPHNIVYMKLLYSQFQGWALLNGHRPGGINKFGTLLTERGFPSVRGSGGVRLRRGISLK